MSDQEMYAHEFDAVIMRGGLMLPICACGWKHKAPVLTLPQAYGAYKEHVVGKWVP